MRNIFIGIWNIIKILFSFWIILGSMLLIIDFMSYYQFLYPTDFFILINRDLNMLVVYSFIVPVSILSIFSGLRIMGDVIDWSKGLGKKVTKR